MQSETGPEPSILQRIRSHGGLAAIHVIPLTSLDPDHPNDYGRIRRNGWGNVAVCKDGTRIGLSLEDEAALSSGENHV